MVNTVSTVRWRTEMPKEMTRVEPEKQGRNGKDIGSYK